MKYDFSGIRERLIRAKQNILNLDAEIDGFFKTSKYPILSYEDKQLLLEASEYHRRRPIPRRFSILAGEIIHHLRSCFDHIAWQFSCPSYRVSKPTKIEFPIFEVPPSQKPGRTGYEKYVKGIFNPAALILIEVFQPYNSPNPVDSPLSIIHKMDITDKHRELVLCFPTAAVPVSADIVNRYVRYKGGDPFVAPFDLGAEVIANFKRDPKIVPQVSFKNFGGRQIEPVVQGLTELQNFTVGVLGMFERVAEFVDPWA